MSSPPAPLPATGTLVWSLGHSNLSLDDFEELLGAHSIERVVDVRRYPVSSRHPHFGRDCLEMELPRGGVHYVHLADLGGHREPRADSPNLALPPGPFRGYADHMGSSEFARALAQLEALARERRTAVMCAEARPSECHRRLLCDALVARGGMVLHVQRVGAREHVLDPTARVLDGRVEYSRVIQRGLFDAP